MASKRTNQDGGAEKGWTNKRTNVRWSFGMIGMAASVAAAKLSRADFTADDDGDGDANLYYDYMIDEEGTMGVGWDFLNKLTIIFDIRIKVCQ